MADGTAPGVVLQSRLMLYDVETKATRDVSSPAFDTDAGAPQWTAEGNRVLFLSGKRAYNEAFAFDLTTGTLLAAQHAAHDAGLVAQQGRPDDRRVDGRARRRQRDLRHRSARSRRSAS